MQCRPASQGTEECKLNAEDRDDVIAITPDGADLLLLRL